MALDRKDIRDSHVGFIVSDSPDIGRRPAMLRVSDALVLVEVPDWRGLIEQLNPDANEAHPTRAMFYSADRSFSLTGLGPPSRSVRGQIGKTVFEVAQLVESRQCWYETLHGLRSELQGLSGWISPETFSFEFEQNESNRIQRVSFTAEGKPNIPVPGIDGLSLRPSFNTDLKYSSRLYTMSDSTQIETLFDEPRDWDTHKWLHRIFQDLISIAYWHPCNLTADKVFRTDDFMTVQTPDGIKDLDPDWHAVVLPDFGRRTQNARIKHIPSGARPLFYFNDIGIEGVGRWFAEADELGQAMWVLASSLFREGGTAEVELLQAGTALEALGYELAIRSGRLTRGQRDRKFHFTSALEMIANETDCSLDKVLNGEPTVSAWASLFNAAYKGVKHADNPLPNGVVANYRAQEGVLLAQLWLARHLGVDRDTLESRIQFR